MQVQTNKTKVKGGTVTLKKGTKVRWSSQAGGIRTTKTGTIVCVLKKNTTYWGGRNFPVNFMVPLYQKVNECTQVRARDLFAYAGTYDNEEAIQSTYRMKFDLRSEMYRSTPHYLVAVEQKGQKPLLYHPATYTALKVVK